MITSRHVVAVPPGFDFRRTVRSHGWYDLPPFRADGDFLRLECLLPSGDGRLILAVIAPQGSRLGVTLSSQRAFSPAAQAGALGMVRTCLRLDEDFSAFHREARRHPRYRWIASSGAGHLLRAPTVFEDVVKMLCTTNCSWALTRTIVTNLVERYGKPWDAERRAFPLPAVLAGTTEEELRRSIRAGYRAPAILRFAEDVARGELDVGSWRDSPLSTEVLYRNLLTVRGIGPYAAGNLLKLLGRYDYLGLDSWVRARYAELYARGRRVSDRAIERAYAPYGAWRGLFFWLEMTRYWHDRKFPGRPERRDDWSAV